MDFELGNKPQEMTVNLSPDNDFIAQMKNTNGDWDTGIEVELRFANGVVWPATVTGDLIYWNVDKADVEDVLTSSTYVGLYYTDGDKDILWARGYVVVT